jgi:hypothetical protein
MVLWTTFMFIKFLHGRIVTWIESLGNGQILHTVTSASVAVRMMPLDCSV